MNKFLKSIGSYTLVNVINKGIPFLLLPILTNYLSPADFGLLTNIESLIVVLVVLIGINISTAVTRQYVKDQVDLKVYVSTAFKIILISFCVISIILIGLGDLINEWTAIPTDILYIIPVFALLDNMMEVVLAIWRMEDKPFSYGSFRVGRTIIEITIALSLIIGLKYDWHGRFYGLYIAGILSGMIAILFLLSKKYLNRFFDKDYKSHFLKFGLPLIPHTISGVIIMYSDKLIITKYLGIGENGVYSVAFTIGMAISLLQNSFNQAWVPWLFKKLALNSIDEKKKLVKITYVYMVMMLLLALLLWLITPVIYLFLGQDFSGGMDVVAIIGLGFAFNGMYKMMINYLFYAEKTKIISLITLSIAVINISLSVYLVKDYGIIGTAYASAISFFIQFIVTWIISAKVYPMPWFKIK
ncbi:MAG: lipopolysaccharide biosynthesis protein [Putridiphycobacter sp.]